MVKYLALAFVLCVLCPQSDAVCGTTLLKAGQTHCLDDADNTWYPLGSLWRNSACMECSCGAGGMRCCSTFSVPRDFPDDCVSVFDSELCLYIVHKKNDPTTQCPVFSATFK